MLEPSEDRYREGCREEYSQSDGCQREVFSSLGFRAATHEVICGQAGVNKAAINHHFGGKKALYRAVWQHLLDTADRLHPVSGNLPEDAAAMERLETHVRSLLSRHHREGTSWQLARLHDLERVNPTSLVDDIRRSHHGRNRQRMWNALAELLGGKASRSAIEFYETGVFRQAACDQSRRRDRRRRRTQSRREERPRRSCSGSTGTKTAR